MTNIEIEVNQIKIINKKCGKYDWAYNSLNRELFSLNLYKRSFVKEFILTEY